MRGVLTLMIESFSKLEAYGPSGAPNIQATRGYKIQLVKDHARVVYEVTLGRETLPVDPTVALMGEVQRILAAYLPQIDPRPES